MLQQIKDRCRSDDLFREKCFISKKKRTNTRTAMNFVCVLCLHACDGFWTKKKVIKSKMTQQELSVHVNRFLFVNSGSRRKVKT